MIFLFSPRSSFFKLPKFYSNLSFLLPSISFAPILYLLSYWLTDQAPKFCCNP
jgi:hypothetical protein